MKKLLIALSAVALLMTACQKEASIEDPNSTPGSGGGGGTVSQGLLTRVVYVSGADSAAIDYGYDASKRLISFSNSSTGGSNQFTRITRNSVGIMTQYTSKSPDLVSVGIDSLITYLSYDNAQSHYSYSFSTFTLAGVTYTDSTVFTYDGSGNITLKTSYAKANPAPYQLYSKTEYTYASGNATSEKYYSMNSSGGWDLDGTYNYTYDAKVNPVKLGAEAIIALDDATYLSTNNVAKIDYVDGVDVSNNFTFTTTYTYNSSNKPSGGTAVETPGPTNYNLRYYYN